MISLPFIDREAEAAKLRSLLDRGKPALALVHGRRRVGKTYLLSHLWPSGQVLYYSSSSTTPAINRQALVEEAARWSGEELRIEDHPTWRTVFRTLFSLRPSQPVAIVLDEFQYLADGEIGLREITSELKRRVGIRPVPLSGSAGSPVRVSSAYAGGAGHGRFASVRAA